MQLLKQTIDKEDAQLKKTEYMGVFADNHDVRRFMYDQAGDLRSLKATMVLTLTMRGIPFVYYGTEYGFAGGDDPANRESLWPSINNQEPHEMQLHLTRLNKFRKAYEIWDHR